MSNEEVFHRVLNGGMTHDDTAEGDSHIESTELLSGWSRASRNGISVGLCDSNRCDKTHLPRTELMKVKIGIKAVFVLFEQSPRRKDVAADIGEL
jgi:hypothetical protein